MAGEGSGSALGRGWGRPRLEQGALEQSGDAGSPPPTATEPPQCRSPLMPALALAPALGLARPCAAWSGRPMVWGTPRAPPHQQVSHASHRAGETESRAVTCPPPPMGTVRGWGPGAGWGSQPRCSKPWPPLTCPQPRPPLPAPTHSTVAVCHPTATSAPQTPWGGGRGEQQHRRASPEHPGKRLPIWRGNPGWGREDAQHPWELGTDAG